jgi:hypothetical protein
VLGSTRRFKSLSKRAMIKNKLGLFGRSEGETNTQSQIAQTKETQIAQTQTKQTQTPQTQQTQKTNKMDKSEYIVPNDVLVEKTDSSLKEKLRKFKIRDGQINKALDINDGFNINKYDKALSWIQIKSKFILKYRKL